MIWTKEHADFVFAKKKFHISMNILTNIIRINTNVVNDWHSHMLHLQIISSVFFYTVFRNSIFLIRFVVVLLIAHLIKPSM